MWKGSEAVPGLAAPDSRLVDVAEVVGEIDTADGVMLVGDITGKQADLEVSGVVAIAQSQTAFKLRPEGEFNTLV